MQRKLQLLPIPTLLSYADTTAELLDPGGKREEEEIFNFHPEACSSPHCTVYSTWAPYKSTPVSQSHFLCTCHIARGLLLELCQAENSRRRL